MRAPSNRGAPAALAERLQKTGRARLSSARPRWYGREIAPGDGFHIDMHVFDCRPELMGAILATFEQLGETGLGPGRGRAALTRVEQIGVDESACEMALRPGPPSVISLDPEPAERGGAPGVFALPDAHRVEGWPGRRSERRAAVRRALCPAAGSHLDATALYGAGPLAIDFRGLGERARAVKLVSSDIEWIGATPPFEAATGQSHPLGGFTGVVEYAGELGEFLPWLRAARWTGRWPPDGMGQRRPARDLTLAHALMRAASTSCRRKAGEKPRHSGPLTAPY